MQENRQLNGLLKEYEQTMETIMNKFRSHAVRFQSYVPIIQFPDSPFSLQLSSMS